MNVHCKISLVQKRAKKIFSVTKFPNQIPDKDSQVFNQLKEQNISLEEVAN